MFRFITNDDWLLERKSVCESEKYCCWFLFLSIFLRDHSPDVLIVDAIKSLLLTKCTSIAVLLLFLFLCVQYGCRSFVALVADSDTGCCAASALSPHLDVKTILHPPLFRLLKLITSREIGGRFNYQLSPHIEAEPRHYYQTSYSLTPAPFIVFQMLHFEQVTRFQFSFTAMTQRLHLFRSRFYCFIPSKCQLLFVIIIVLCFSIS
jgi:hypothetical protein